MKNSISILNVRTAVRLTLFSAILLSAALSPAAPGKLISGKVLGFDQIRQDDIVDGAVVIPSMRAREVLSFQIGGLIGPTEEMPIGPIKAKVPGNLFLPNQKERYGFIPVTLSKESFKLMLEPGQSNELVSISFQAPFTKLADLGRARAPYTEIVPLISFKKFGISEDRDWSRERSLNLRLDHNFLKTPSFSWKRARAQQNQFDALVAFQRTPKDKWMLADFVAKIPASGKFASGSGLQDELKVLFVRITNDSQNNPKSAQGWMTTGKSSELFSREGVPPALQSGLLKGQRIDWTPVMENGWMAVLRNSKSKRPVFKLFSERLLHDTFAIFGHFGIFPQKKPLLSSPLEAWIDPKTGSYELQKPLQSGEHLVLLFVGSDRAVPSPDESQIAEPELFTYADQLRMIVLQ